MAARTYLFLAVTTFLTGAWSEHSDAGSYLNRDWKNSVGTGESKTLEKHLFFPSNDQSRKDLNDYRVDESKIIRLFSDMHNVDGAFTPGKHLVPDKQQFVDMEENKNKDTGDLNTDDEDLDHLRYLETKVSKLKTVQNDKILVSIPDPSANEDVKLDDILNTNDQPMPFVSIIADIVSGDDDALEDIENEPKHTVISENINSTNNPKEEDTETVNTESKGNTNIIVDTVIDDKINKFAMKDASESTLRAKVLQRHIFEFKKNLSECLKEVERNEKGPIKVLSPRFESPTHANCLIACVLKRNEIIDGFNINKDNLMNLVLKFFEKNSKAVKKLSKNLNKCIEISRKYKNECDIAATLNTCTNDVMGSMKKPVDMKN